MQATEEPAQNGAAALPIGVEVKGWRNGLLLTVPPVGDWEAVLTQVDARLDEARARSFWRGAQVTLICGARVVPLGELTVLCERIKTGWGLVPVAVVAVDADTRGAGEKLALVAYEELPVIKIPERRDRDRTPKASDRAETPLAAVVVPALPALPSAGSNALYVQQTVRSGQRIVHDGHVVVCGDVNAGAEVVAGGDVLVFGTLRGLAHAGSFGNESARIVAGSLRPPQLRIAQKIARAPEEGPKGKEMQAARTPEVARIENGEIGVFPL